MYQLTIKAAFAYVRKALDELTSVEEIGMLVSPDALDLHKIVEAVIVEAAVKVHQDAPSLLLDGIMAKEGEFSAERKGTDAQVIDIAMKKDVVRIVSIKSTDSSYVVCDFIPEDSAEGRKQLNKYIRGTHDDPRVVLNKVWEGDRKPRLTYYCLEETTETPQFDIEYIPYPEIEETIIMISQQLEFAVLNEVVAMVLDSLNEPERAAIYRTKVKEYLER